MTFSGVSFTQWRNTVVFICGLFELVAGDTCEVHEDSWEFCVGECCEDEWNDYDICCESTSDEGYGAVGGAVAGSIIFIIIVVTIIYFCYRMNRGCKTPIQPGSTVVGTTSVAYSQYPMQNTQSYQYPSNFNQNPSNVNQYPSNVNRYPSNVNQYPSNVNHSPSSFNHNFNQGPSNFNQGPGNFNQGPSNFNQGLQPSAPYPPAEQMTNVDPVFPPGPAKY